MVTAARLSRLLANEGFTRSERDYQGFIIPEGFRCMRHATVEGAVCVDYMPRYESGELRIGQAYAEAARHLAAIRASLIRLGYDVEENSGPFSSPLSLLIVCDHR